MAVQMWRVGLAVVVVVVVVLFVTMWPEIKEKIEIGALAGCANFTLDVGEEALLVYKIGAVKKLELSVRLVDVDAASKKAWVLAPGFIREGRERHVLEVGDSVTAFVTEEGGVRLELVDVGGGNATFKTWLEVGPPHPLGPLRPVEIVKRRAAPQAPATFALGVDESALVYFYSLWYFRVEVRELDGGVVLAVTDGVEARTAALRVGGRVAVFSEWDREAFLELAEAGGGRAVFKAWLEVGSPGRRAAAAPVVRVSKFNYAAFVLSLGEAALLSYQDRRCELELAGVNIDEGVVEVRLGTRLVSLKAGEAVNCGDIFVELVSVNETAVFRAWVDLYRSTEKTEAVILRR